MQVAACRQARGKRRHGRGRARLLIPIDPELTTTTTAVVVSGFGAGFPAPEGALVPLPAPLAAGQKVRARQRFGGVTSAWSAPITARDHTVDYPAGPPRPQIDPAPVYQCGRRTGVANL